MFTTNTPNFWIQGNTRTPAQFIFRDQPDREKKGIAFNIFPAIDPTPTLDESEKIAFRSGSIWIMNTDGSNVLRLVEGNGYSGGPIWQP